MRGERTGAVVIFGGAGLVGAQVARALAEECAPEAIVVGGLYQREVRESLKNLRREFPGRTFKGFHGDIFVREEFRNRGREWILASVDRTESLFEDTFGSRSGAYERSALVRVLREHRPEVVVDCVNTATAISYQDIFTISREEVRILDRMIEDYRGDRTIESLSKDDIKSLYTLLISQAIPQLIRHVQILHAAMREVGTRMYLKIGTTGTGGMGLNIPYTHSEDKPSAKLMSKTAVAFAHTGLLFLMARTPDGPVVKEIKPGAMIGYRRVAFQTIKRGNRPLTLWGARSCRLADRLPLRLPPESFDRRGDLETVFVDTGENGLFTRGEFETITHMGQMEFVTPEEIARNVVLEIRGSNTGKDVIAAVDGAVMDPSYRAGILRPTVLEEMRALETRTGDHSVALGMLGPPELGKLLWEGHLLALRHRTLSRVLEHDANALASDLFRFLSRRRDLRDRIVSIGLAVLAPDGDRLWRGPRLSIPEYRGDPEPVATAQTVDAWARKGWVDLRPSNMEGWLRRCRKMRRARHRVADRGSAAVTREVYLGDDIRIGEVVAWIFGNEEAGFRLK